MAIVEYGPGAAFPGVIGRTADESTPAWPAPVRAREGAPNVLFIVLDDTGYGQLGCYGGLSATPNLDALAARGTRFTSAYTACPICVPARAAFAVGRYVHDTGLAIPLVLLLFGGTRAMAPIDQLVGTLNRRSTLQRSESGTRSRLSQ